METLMIVEDGVVESNGCPSNRRFNVPCVIDDKVNWERSIRRKNKGRKK